MKKSIMLVAVMLMSGYIPARGYDAESSDVGAKFEGLWKAQGSQIKAATREEIDEENELLAFAVNINTDDVCRLEGCPKGEANFVYSPKETKEESSDDRRGDVWYVVTPKQICRIILSVRAVSLRDGDHSLPLNSIHCAS